MLELNMHIMNKYKHSGTMGDLIYSLPVVKHFGGGEFYLHLNQVDWIGQHYYNSTPAPFHRGRMTQEDYEFMKTFMEAQDYISQFETLDPSRTEITHNLDRFRPAFVHHPGNYVDIYCQTFGLLDTRLQQELRNQPWLTVPEPRPIKDRPYVINRTARWLPTDTKDTWDHWRLEGVEQQSVFVGLPQEYDEFRQFSGWDIPHEPTPSLLDMAQVIAGAAQFVGNQSVALSLAIGLGVDWVCEARKDLPLERNECYFPEHPKGEYF